MKNFLIFLIILHLVSCVSTKNVAENRNGDYTVHNSFEFFKIWRELDILRFNNDILNIKIALLPENGTSLDIETNSQVLHIYDSIAVLVENKMSGFQDLKKTYFDTTDQEKRKIYQRLKSDSTDLAFLNKITDNPYFELYKEILNRLRLGIQKSQFYISQKNFENYIQNRSIELLNKKLSKEIFGTDTLRIKNLSQDKIDKLRQNQVNFIIAFSGSYNIDYSDRARGHIGSETIQLILFDVQSVKIISTAELTRFWGSE